MRNAALHIPSDDADENPFDIALTGTGLLPGTLQFSSANYTVSEGVASATINVTRTGGTDGIVGATYQTVAGGTATGGAACTTGVDYINTSGLVSFGNGSAASQTFSITICPDAALEPDESINLSLTTPTGGATIGSPNASVLIVTNDDCLVAPSTVYVDDNWVGTTPGTDPDAGGPATNFGCDAFATIQGGVNGVASAGTVNVAAGTYAESQVLITRAMTVVGAGLATTTIDGGTAANVAAGTVRIDLPIGVTGNVSFSGFTIINPGVTGSNRYHLTARQQDAVPSITVSNNRMQGTSGLMPADYAFWAYQPRGPIVFNNNDMVDNTSNPVLIENPIGAGATTDVHTNTISGNVATAIFAMAYGGNDVTALQRVANNTISGALSTAISINGAFGGGASAGRYTNVQITGNIITGLTATRTGINLVNQAASGNQPAGAIENAIVTGNRISGTGAATSYGVRTRGGVVNPSISGNDIRNLDFGIWGEVRNGGFVTGAEIHLNNIVGHTAGIQWDSAVAANAENNWWGCNAGPGNAGCSPVAGAGAASVDFDPWIVLGVSASPNPITPGATSTVTANMTQNSAGGTPVGTIPSIPVGFTATQGTIAPPSGTITAGLAASTFTSTSSTSGTGCATVDNQLVCTNVNVTAPNFTIDDVTLAEGNASTTSFTFTITRNGGSALASSVTYATANGTAVAPGDLTAISPTVLNFGPSAGNATQTVTVLVNGDTQFELNEDFTVQLTAPVNATISDASGLGTINNDDPCVVNPIVQNNLDDGVGSLRRAVFEACTGSTITFNMGTVVSPISLSGGQIVIDKDLTVQGPGAGVLTVQNTAAASPTSRIFAVPGGVTATVSGLTLTGGNTSVANGGAINNSGTLTLTNMVITGNNAGSTTSFGGGGIANQGTINLNSTTVSNNTSMGGGGGLMMVNGGTTNITSSTFSGNTGNSAGAILAQSFPSGSGGLPGTLTVTNSTISGNTASAATPCGGIWVNGTLSTANITSSTITNNTGTFGGGLCSAGGPITVRSTIIAGNVNNSVVPDVDTTFTSQGFNLIGNVGTATGFNQPTDQTGTGASPLNPQLVALANNGGPTQTHALLATSPAYDKGNAFGLTLDQRGAGFPRTINNPSIPPATGGDNTDIGAFEIQNTPPTIAAVATTRQAGSPVSNSTIANVTDAESGNGGVVVTVTTANPSNGVTISNIVNTAGVITADVVAACGATTATFTLTATDGGSLTATATLTVTVTANTPPAVTYNSPQNVVFGQSGFTVPTATATDNGSITGYVLQSVVPPMTVAPTVNAANGTVTINAAGPVGPHVITVRSTDNCGLTTDSSFTLNVDKANTTTTVTAAPASPSVFGQSVTFTATVAVVAPGAGTPTGTVSFNIDGNIYCANTPINGSFQATCTQAGLPALPAGLRDVVAIYSGNANFNGSTGDLNYTVNKANTTTTITNTVALATPTLVNQPYTVAWAVVPNPVQVNSGTPTGTVTVNGGAGGGSCSAPVAAGSCQVTPTTIGVKSVTATYNGDANFNPSTSTPVNHTVNVQITGTVRQAPAMTPIVGLTMTMSGCASATATTNASGVYTIVFGGPLGSVCTITPPAGLFDPVNRTFTVNDNITGADFTRYASAADIPRTLSLNTQFVVPGASGSMPVVLDSQGNEASVSFTVQYPFNTMATAPTFVCGPQAPGCTITTDTSTLGRVGVTIVPAGGVFSMIEAVEGEDPTAQKQVATMNFTTVATGLPNAAITFVNSPVDLVTRDAASNPLLTRYIDGLIVFAQGLEGDVANRNTGNGAFEAADVVQVRRFVAGLDTPVGTHNEFQRADSAPASVGGDGFLSATDVVQTRRYVAGLDPSRPSAGPGVANSGPIAPPEALREAGSREIRIGSSNASTGSRVSVPVEMVANGDEMAVSFIVRYDATRLGNASVELANSPDGAILTANADEPGVIRILVDAAAAFARSREFANLVNISFDVSDKAPTGDTRILIEGSSVSDARATSLGAKATNGVISIAGPNALSVEISGRVLIPGGAGLRNATVTLTDASGVTRSAITGTFGYYRIDGIAPGQSYTLAVTSRRYRFAQTRITPADSLSNVDLIAQE
ncbi:MAG: Ig-like domain repeat protein [Pyrinomonadaceae bacterium]